MLQKKRVSELERQIPPHTYQIDYTCEISYSPVECTNKTGRVEKQWTVGQGQIALLD